MNKVNSTIRISVFGLGKLGSSIAACAAYRGFKVIGYDINPESVDKFSQGNAPTYEHGLDELISKVANNLSATNSPAFAVQNSDVSFVVVPTPSLESGEFDTSYAENCMLEIGRALRAKNEYHLIIMTSTVLPGTSRNQLIPLIESESGKQCGDHFGFCYNPEFIALGSVIRDFLNPDFYLVGQFDQRSGDLLSVVHNAVSLNSAPIKRMTIENAELAKIALNSFVTLKISFANLVADFCEEVLDGDVDVVTDALALDSRIGGKYLRGGLGFAGPCFPRDNVALAWLGNQLGLDTSLLLANHRYNEGLPERLKKELLEVIPKGSIIGILGLAYKPNAKVIDHSQGVALCKLFADEGFSVAGHDSIAVDEARKVLPNTVKLTENLSEILEMCNVIIICHPGDTYRLEDLSLNSTENQPKKVIDFWRNSSNYQRPKNVKLWFRGRNCNDF